MLLFEKRKKAVRKNKICGFCFSFQENNKKQKRKEKKKGQKSTPTIFPIRQDRRSRRHRLAVAVVTADLVDMLRPLEVRSSALAWRRRRCPRRRY